MLVAEVRRKSTRQIHRVFVFIDEVITNSINRLISDDEVKSGHIFLRYGSVVVKISHTDN